MLQILVWNGTLDQTKAGGDPLLGRQVSLRLRGMRPGRYHRVFDPSPQRRRPDVGAVVLPLLELAAAVTRAGLLRSSTSARHVANLHLREQRSSGNPPRREALDWRSHPPAPSLPLTVIIVNYFNRFH